jgi:hypothetical protein
MTFTIVATGLGNFTFKTKRTKDQPTLSGINRMITSWDNAYGAYLRYSFFVNGVQVTKSEMTSIPEFKV